MNVFTSGFGILENCNDVENFIDGKIRELNKQGSEDPFYVANLDTVLEKHQRWQSCLPRVTPFYAVKCNNTPAILQMLSALGTGFDCASKREMEMVLSSGVTPDRILYAHTAKPPSHIRYACANGVDTMTFDSEEELVKIATSHPSSKLVLRIVVDDSKSMIKLSSKFGAKLQSVGSLLKRAQELHLDIIGVSFHVGCLCTDSIMYKKAIADARRVFDQAISTGFQMNLLDIGGGFYGSEEFQMASKGINEALDEFFPAGCGVKIIAEPGRYFVDSAFTLAVNVFAKKQMILSDEVSQEGGNGKNTLMMYYVTDGIYGAFADSYFYPGIPCNLRPHKPVHHNEPRYSSIIWGPTCDSIDRIQDLQMPELHVGDWILAYNKGAYSITLSSGFNGFGKGNIYLVATADTWKIFNHSLPSV